MLSGDLVGGVVLIADVDVYKAKERSLRVQAYVPESFLRKLEALGRLWSILDRVNNDAKPEKDRLKPEELKEWSESDVARRLLEVATDAALKEIDGALPATEEAWAEFEAKMRKRLKAANRNPVDVATEAALKAFDDGPPVSKEVWAEFETKMRKRLKLPSKG